MVRIVELEFDDYNEEELAKHRIVPREIIEIFENPYTVRRNKKTGSGDRQVIGRTNGGRFLTIILAATVVPGRWRPVTGWPSTRGERSALP
jgi:hypothetical protein